MLLKHFYTVQELEYNGPNTIIATIVLNADHPIFQGHFHNFPVTPGVALLQILKELTEDYCKQLLFLQTATNVKFLNLVNPNLQSSLVFKLSITEDGDLVKVKNVTSFRDESVVLKCNVNFAKRYYSGL